MTSDWTWRPFLNWHFLCRTVTSPNYSCNERFLCRSLKVCTSESSQVNFLCSVRQGFFNKSMSETSNLPVRCFFGSMGWRRLCWSLNTAPCDVCHIDSFGVVGVGTVPLGGVEDVGRGCGSVSSRLGRHMGDPRPNVGQRLRSIRKHRGLHLGGIDATKSKSKPSKRGFYVGCTRWFSISWWFLPFKCYTTATSCSNWSTFDGSSMLCFWKHFVQISTAHRCSWWTLSWRWSIGTRILSRCSENSWTIHIKSIERKENVQDRRFGNVVTLWTTSILGAQWWNGLILRMVAVLCWLYGQS